MWGVPFDLLHIVASRVTDVRVTLRQAHPSTPLCGASILILRQAPHSGRQDDRSPSVVAMPPLRVTGDSFLFNSFDVLPRPLGRG